MTVTNMNAIDLNLLRVFDALLEEGNVTRAGYRLGLTQSAVSHALGRLREALGDELFVRSQHGIRPTARAQEMGPEIHAALSRLQAALSVKSFDPAITERQFSIMAGPYSSAILIPALVERMAEAAPNASLQIVEGGADIIERMDARRIDFVVGSAESGPDRVRADVLFRETLVWAVRNGHPLTEGQLTLERLIETPHVAIRRQRVVDGRGLNQLVMRATWEDMGALEAKLRDRNLKRKIGVTVPDAYSAMAVVRRSDMAALLPARMAEIAVGAGMLHIIGKPYQSPPMDVSLLCLHERLSEPAMAWMHGLLKQVASEVGEPRENTSA
jgi:DNA-binding transcriptional LysR family regulator